MHLSSPPYVLHARPFHSSCLYHPNNIRRENHGHFHPYNINVTVNNIITEKGIFYTIILYVHCNIKWQVM